MAQSLLLMAAGLPLGLALLLGTGLRQLTLWLFPLAALPALALVLCPPVVVDIPWLLTGIRLASNDFNAPLLLLAGLLWTAAGCYAKSYLAEDEHLTRFVLFYLLTLSGNMGVALAADLVGFYLFYTLMTFAAYGLIVHSGQREALRAGRVYLSMGIAGEVLLLAVVLISAAQFGETDIEKLLPALANAENRDLLMGLAFVAFAIKAGVIPVHMWLPLAHPCAPTPASAVLSGVIIKTGFIGWLTFLPLGQAELPAWGGFCFLIGLVTTFFAVLMGLFQGRPKTILAYSSISQMGLLTMLLSLGLQMPAYWDLSLSALLLFVVHHGLAKATLFLGLGVVERAQTWRYYPLLLLPALSLVGVPLTSGALAKSGFEATLKPAPVEWAAVLSPLLIASSIATAVLMIRFLYVTRPQQSYPRKNVSALLWLSCISLLAASLTLPWWWGIMFMDMNSNDLLKPAKLVMGLLPLAIAALLATAAWGIWRLSGRPPLINLPEGDILALFPSIALLRERFILANAASPNSGAVHSKPHRRWHKLFSQTENWTDKPGWVGLLFLSLIGGLIILFWVAS